MYRNILIATDGSKLAEMAVVTWSVAGKIDWRQSHCPDR